MLVIETNAFSVAELFQRLDAALKKNQYGLMYDVGRVGMATVQKRIRNQDEGQWPQVSKWIKAKKNVDVPLKGADRFVKMKATAGEAKVYGDTGGDWTLSQHDEGFENKAHDHAFVGDAFEIEISNPSPLRLSPGTRKFKWKETGNEIGPTPARKIWDEEEDVMKWMKPMVSRWLEITVEGALK